MTGPLTRHHHLKGHLFVLGLVGSYGCDRCKQDLKRPHMFFVNVRHWWYKDSGTLAITTWNQLTVLISPSARYCTLFKVWGSWMLQQRVAQKIGNNQGTRVTVVPALVYCTLFFPNGDITFHSVYPQAHHQVHKPFQNKTWGQKSVLKTVKVLPKYRGAD